MTQTVTRADIADALYDKLGFSHAESLKLVDHIFDTLVTTLSKGEDLKISGFASFLLHDKKSRVGRNPRTGKEHEITPRTVISFKASHILKNAVDKG